MGSLFNDWINLFDEKNFQNIQNEPLELRAVTMLFVTIQKEFQKMEISLSNQLKTYKLGLESKNHMLNVEEKYVKEETIPVFDSPKENNKSSVHKINKNNKMLLKSPTFDRHRRTNMKKVKKPLSFPSLVTSKNVETFTTPKKNNQSNQNNLNDSDDIFDSSIIDMTPNIEVSKRSRSTLTSQKKKTHSSSTTLTQMFSGINTKDNKKKDETTMMDIDEILERVENAEKNDIAESKNSSMSVSKSLKISDSFVEDYDKLPESKKKPEKSFVYKETVRGNKKSKLRGWSCKDCENFYKKMNLSEEELEKRMNECSKHRNKFKPDEETIPGYWDLSIRSTPEEDESAPSSSPESSQNTLNESTIFCFYKK